MEFICNFCDYKTTKKCDFNKHNTTKKHNNNLIKNKYCVECDKYFDSLKKYKEHLYYHSKKDIEINNKDDLQNNTNTNKVIINKIDDINNKQNILLEENKDIKNKLNNVMMKASSLIKYLMKYHASTPPMQLIDYNKCLNLLRIDLDCEIDEDDEKDKTSYKLEKELIDQHKKRKFTRIISRVILKLVHHKDPIKSKKYVYFLLFIA